MEATFRTIGERESGIVRNVNKLFSELTTYRNIFAGQWEEAAALIRPDSRNTFMYGSYNFPGQKRSQYQVDMTGALALDQFCAIADSLITPKNRLWHGIEASDADLLKDRKVADWCQKVRDALFRYRYRAEANFHGQNFPNWQSLGAFGNSVMFIDQLDTRWGGSPGLRYKAVPLGECFFAENHQGVVTILVRWFRLTAVQAAERFGEEWLPPQLRPALKQNLQTPYQFLHCVMPRDEDEYDPERLDYKGMPFCSYYVSVEGQCLMPTDRVTGQMEGGYRQFPYAVSRYTQMPGEVYGRGPAQFSLPGLKTLNAQKTTFLKTGHRASDPVLLTSDDGLLDFDLRPGVINKGAVTQDGKPLVHALPVGDIQITEKMMQEERGLIENMFMTPLFKTLMQNPNMTATQVTELINERAMLVAPTLGRQHSEFAGSGLVPREIGLLLRMRNARGQPILPPIPPALVEAGGEYEVTDTSPLAMQAKSAQVAGTLRSLEVANQITTATGDASVYDYFNFDVIMPAIGRANEMPIEFSATPQEIAAKRQNRARAQERQAQIQAMPAQAAMLKAQAQIRKAPQIGAPQQQVPA